MNCEAVVNTCRLTLFCLQQATAPAPAVNIANIDAMVTNCTAFYPYSLQAQTGAPAPSR